MKLKAKNGNPRRRRRRQRIHRRQEGCVVVPDEFVPAVLDAGFELAEGAASVCSTVQRSDA
jgi:hypothetical protein